MHSWGREVEAEETASSIPGVEQSPACSRDGRGVLKGWNGGEGGGKSRWGVSAVLGHTDVGGCCGDLGLYLSDTGEEGTVLSRGMMGSVLCCGCLIFIYFLFLAAWGLPCQAQVSLGAARGGLLAVGAGISAQGLS